jgi:hypothetical protein
MDLKFAPMNVKLLKMKHAPVIRQPLDARQHAYPYGKKNE